MVGQDASQKRSPLAHPFLLEMRVRCVRYVGLSSSGFLDAKLAEAYRPHEKVDLVNLTTRTGRQSDAIQETADENETVATCARMFCPPGGNRAQGHFVVVVAETTTGTARSGRFGRTAVPSQKRSSRDCRKAGCREGLRSCGDRHQT